MNKTFVTVMPNHIGAFLKASRCFAALGINITRVSYNKAVDSHMLFIDAEGTQEQLMRASEELEKIGYLQMGSENKRVVLLEFRLPDVPGSVTAVLELINIFSFNISYISSHENGTDYQLFKMGLIVDDPDRVSVFIEEARKICSVRVIDYNPADNIYDNSIFYNTFVGEIAGAMDIPEESRDELIINTNLAMQQLDEEGTSPYRTFDSISRFVEMLAASRGKNFSPRITKHVITEKTEITLIEPPCGSNTAIIRSGDEYLFMDTGYACYRKEMLDIIHELIPSFDDMFKKVFITHADVDHCGLLPLFDEIYASERSADCLMAEYEGRDGFRETNRLHKPYIRICKVLTSHETVLSEKIHRIGRKEEIADPLMQIGFFDFGELHFEIYEGKGGHLKGETVLIDFGHHLVFSGDIFINMKDMTAQQAQYNRYAPILMTSVDTDPKLCAQERSALFNRLGAGTWQIFGGHGGRKLYQVEVGSPGQVS